MYNPSAALATSLAVEEEGLSGYQADRSYFI